MDQPGREKDHGNDLGDEMPGYPLIDNGEVDKAYHKPKENYPFQQFKPLGFMSSLKKKQEEGKAREQGDDRSLVE